MKSAVLYLLAAVAAVNAMPVMEEGSDLEQRQATGGQDTSNDLKNGPCMPVTFIMARGSTESGNMGNIPGPPTCAGLKAKMPNQVACQGIGAEDGYAAALQPNFMPKNTDDQSIAGATKIINMADTKCPNSTIIVGGYSQGSAVVDNAIQGLSASTRSKIVGVALFGFTRNAQDNAQIPGYPKDQTVIFCAQGDKVCDNTLTISAAHLSYAANADQASSFLVSMVQKSAGGVTVAPGATAPTTGATGATGGATKAAGGKKKKKTAKGAVAKGAVARMAIEFESAKVARGIEVE